MTTDEDRALVMRLADEDESPAQAVALLLVAEALSDIAMELRGLRRSSDVPGGLS